MVVKEKRGRRRYIAFALTRGGPMTKGGLASLLSRSSIDRGVEEPRIIQFDGVKGIVRCDHRLKDETLDLLTSLGEGHEGLEIRTLSTSGTLRTLRDRYF